MDKVEEYFKDGLKREIEKAQKIPQENGRYLLDHFSDENAREYIAYIAIKLLSDSLLREAVTRNTEDKIKAKVEEGYSEREAFDLVVKEGKES
jgi:IMP cyclohydrolase